MTEIEYFQTLYSDESGAGVVPNIPNGFTLIDDSIKDSLLIPPLDEEILRIVKFMGSYKSFEIDGLPPIFYQS